MEAATAPWNNAWRRQSPILGAEGFDGGFKPAIAFAIPTKRPVFTPEDFDTNPPPPPCDTYFEHDLELAVSGVLVCDACWSYGSSGFFYKITAFTGNGIFTLPWNGFSWGGPTLIGTATIETWGTIICDAEVNPDDPDVPLDPIDTTTIDILAIAGCGGGQFGVQATGDGTGIIPHVSYSFVNAAGLLPGVPGENGQVLLSCAAGDQIIFNPIIGGYNGFVTVTPIP